MKSWSAKLAVTLGCSLLIGIGLGNNQQVSAEGIQTEVQKNVKSASYESNFSQQLGNWQDIVGKAEKHANGNGLQIANQKINQQFESVSLLLDAGVRNSGDLEYTFLYEGQTNFGLVFRGDHQATSNWQSFAYMREGEWQLGQPGGKWVTSIKGPTLISGQTYKLLLRYEGTSIRAYLNDRLLYETQEVVYPDGTTINGDWSGYSGIRLFGNESKLTIYSMRSGEVNSLQVEEPTEEFQTMKANWKEQLVSTTTDLSNPAIANYVSTLSTEAEKLYNTMNKEAERTYLWPLESGNTASADLTTQFTKLQKLALAYGTKGTSFYQDKTISEVIQAGIDFMISKKGYDGTKYHGNWWDWQIGVAQKFVSILMVLDEEVPAEKLQQYTSILSKYVPDPFKQLYTKPQENFVALDFIPNFSTTGANRTDLAQTVLGLGLLQNDPAKVTQAVASITDVFKLVTHGDGFYQDGSFIQHETIPYTGSYGNVLVKGVGQILSIVKESRYTLAADQVKSFVDNVQAAFIPLVYQGEMLPLVNGRSISRAASATKNGYGSTTMYNLLIVARFAPETQQKALREAVKYWMLGNPDYYLTNTRDYNDLMMTTKLLDNATIMGDQLPFIGTKMYHAMDRFVQRTKNYHLGLSMYSKRISSFEAGNLENQRGWHTSDGMVYLYNDDQVQFGPSYWPTVDPYRLPGTTVDTVPLADEVSAFTTVTSNETWVGGAAAENQGVVGMALNKAGTKNNGTLLPMNVQGKKSWFTLDGQIIALGAGITGDTTASIETIVDNRLLNDSYSYQVLSDKGMIEQSQQTTETSWLLLESDQQHASIGYYFPQKETVDVISETRTGTYREINEAFPSDTQYTGEYRTFSINHGQQPKEADYAYVMLPGTTQADLEAYVAKQPIAILQNTRDIQAVEVQTAGYLGINFWQEQGGEIAGIKTNKPISLLKQTKAEQTVYTIANPTQQTEAVTLSLPSDFTDVVSMSDGVVYDRQANTFIIDFGQFESKEIIVK
ncbi:MULTISPECIES: polysaccharide lyase 8 family protein [unclassified Enterococcus]|uniref:polysaccharide lyase 8 family protein n=1 Tax=unclassified Enterococcus TaxID=2608891 RepID=UPI001A9BC2E9|nr:polysaccharide lyase 8 family protein [Enterococcus sp. DIV1271a]MBO1299700.1 polysaccharide lyase 8 family protein [Enterococcus sp. DIV1271a]